MQFTIGQVEAFIKTLNHMRENPGIFANDVGIDDNIPFHKTTSNSIHNTIRGIKHSFQTLGVTYPQHIEDQITTEKGYNIRSGSPIFAMIDAEMSENDIINELIDITIKTLKRWYNIEGQ